MGFFGSSDDEEKSVEEIKDELQQEERKLKEIEGDRRLEELRERKKKQLKAKKRKRKVKSSRAGRAAASLKESLEDLADDIETDVDRKTSSSKTSQDKDIPGVPEIADGDDKLGTVDVEGEIELVKDEKPGRKSGGKEDDMPSIFEEDDEGFF